MTAGAAERTDSVYRSIGSRAVRERLLDYLEALGIAGSALRDSLATDCLHRARKRVNGNSGEELLRRAIEEAQRRMDAALARLLGLGLTEHAHAIAAARAALLMCGRRQSSDFLFEAGEPDPDVVAQLRETFPIPMPPESPRAMPVQKLDFVLFKSS